jgi:hypothetical protein
MTYLDITGRQESFSRMAFLIEDAKHLAERLEGKVDERKAVPEKDFSSEEMALAYLFGYMIRNIDMDHRAPQNIENIKKRRGKLVPVPFDFDFAHIVGHPHTTDFPDIGKKAFRNWHFDELCVSRDQLDPHLELFRNRKHDILSLFSSAEDLNEEKKQDIMRLLDRFYRVIEDDEQIEREFVRPCRTRS